MNQGTLQYNCMNDFSFLSYPHGIVEACHHAYSHDSYRMHPNALYLRGKISALELGISLTPPRQAPLCRDTWPSSKLLSPSQSNLKMQHQSITFNHKILKILQVFLTCTDFSTFFLEAGSTDQPLRPPWAPQLVCMDWGFWPAWTVECHGGNHTDFHLAAQGGGRWRRERSSQNIIKLSVARQVNQVTMSWIFKYLAMLLECYWMFLVCAASSGAGLEGAANSGVPTESSPSYHGPCHLFRANPAFGAWLSQGVESHQLWI